MSARENIIIIGANVHGLAAEILDTILSQDRYEVVAFYDRDTKLHGSEIRGIPIVGSPDQLLNGEKKFNGALMHIAIGDNISRKEMYRKINECGIRFVSIVHPSAKIHSQSEIEEGCYIGPNAVVGNGVRIGSATILESGAIIQAESRVDSSSYISAGVTVGNKVTIGSTTFIGLGSTILPDIRIGSGVMIDAGSTVVQNVPSGRTMKAYSLKAYPKDIYQDTVPDVSPVGQVYVAQPTMPDYHLLDEKFRKIVASRMLTNFSDYAQQLELNLEELLPVKKALSFPNGTTALMMALRALDIEGEVILPSFTFSATGHAVLWNGLKPVFVDIDPETFNIDPFDVEQKITRNTAAVIGVHVFGNPCEIHELEAIARRHNVKLLFDAAHALGSLYKGTPIGGSGSAECFSLSGTKVVTSAEGGIVTSNDEQMVKVLTMGRNYGAASDYDCHYVGLNGKMSEFHAAIAIEALNLLPESVRRRNQLAELYKKRLSVIPGITFQKVNEGNLSTYKDYAVLIDPQQFGKTRNELMERLNAEGIQTKKYFHPLLHNMPVFNKFRHHANTLPNSEKVADNVICLPMYSHMQQDTLEKVCFAIYRIHNEK